MPEINTVKNVTKYWFCLLVFSSLPALPFKILLRLWRQNSKTRERTLSSVIGTL